MADEIMVLDERISRLEMTVAQGFFDLTGRAGLHDGRIGRIEERMDRLEQRMDGLEQRMDGLEQRMDRLEQRMDRLEEQVSLLNRKIDVMSETLEGKIQSVLEHLSASMTEMRRMHLTLRKEHWADRRVIHAILKDHGIRLRTVEGRRGTTSPGRRRGSRRRAPRA